MVPIFIIIIIIIIIIVFVVHVLSTFITHCTLLCLCYLFAELSSLDLVLTPLSFIFVLRFLILMVSCNWT